jgi:hypothetical protein
MAVVIGSLLLLPALLVLVSGGSLLWAHYLHRSDGFVVSPKESYSSSGYALVSDRIDVSALPGWLPVSTTVGTARLEVTGTGSEDVFVGVARAADARAYLDGVARTAVDGLGFDGPPSYRDQLRGDGPSGPPADQHFWIAQATGSGTEEVTWKPTDADWVFVVMNADGTQRVEVEGRIGAEIPALGWIGWGALAIGSGLTFVAARLLVRGLRRPEDPSLQYREPVGTWSPRRSPVERTASEPAGPPPGGALPGR